MPASIPYGRRTSDVRRRSIFIVSPSAIPPIDDTIDYTPDRAVMPSSERVIFRTPVIPGAVRPCKGHAEPAADGRKTWTIAGTNPATASCAGVARRNPSRR